MGYGSYTEIIQCTFVENVAYSIYGANGSETCMFGNYLQDRAIIIEENALFYSCFYRDPTNPSGECNTAFGSFDDSFDSQNGSSIFEWRIDLFGKASVNTSSDGETIYNAPIVTSGNFTLYKTIVKCGYSNTSLDTSNLDDDCEDLYFIWIFDGYARLIDLSIDNDMDVLYDSAVCDSECFVTENSDNYLVFQQAEIICDGSENDFTSTVEFYLYFEFRMNDSSLRNDSIYQNGLETVFETLFTQASSITIVNVDANIINSRRRRGLLDSNNHTNVALNSTVEISYETTSNQSTAAAIVGTIISAASFTSDLVTSLESADMGIITDSIQNLFYGISSETIISGDSDGYVGLSSETGALTTTTATTGVAYTVALIDTSDVNLTSYFNYSSNDNYAENVTVPDALYGYPGGELEFYIVVVDEDGNIIHPDSFDETIDVTIVQTDVSIDSTFTITYDENEISEHIISLSDVKVDQIGQSFEMTLTVGNNVLHSANINLTVDYCPAGSGVSGDQCVTCSKGYYTIEKNDYECHECPSGLSGDGITCSGNKDLVITAGFYAYIKQDSDGELKAVDCPDGFCCQLDNGCNYFTQQDSFCASNRDYDEPMCGACISGYSEILVGTSCARCKGSRWYWIFVPTILAIIFVFFVTFNRKRERSDEVYVLPPGKVLRVAVLKNLAYYYQTLNLTFPNDIGIYLRAVLAFFSISFESASSGDSTTWCFFEGMDPLFKASVNFGFPLICFMILLLIRICFSKDCKRGMWVHNFENPTIKGATKVVYYC